MRGGVRCTPPRTSRRDSPAPIRMSISSPGRDFDRTRGNTRISFCSTWRIRPACSEPGHEAPCERPLLFPGQAPRLAPIGDLLLRTSPWLLLLLPAFAYADDVHLKGGAVFSGRIVSQTETMITIDIGDGQVGVAMARVDRVVKGPSALDQYDARAARTAPNDANGWRALGLWAAQQGVSAQSRQAYQEGGS